MTNKEKLLKAAGFENNLQKLSSALSIFIGCVDCPVGREGKCEIGSCRESIKKYLEEDENNG